MEEEKETPRSLIRGMLDHKVDMDTTVRITRQAVKDASDKRSSRQHSQSATAELPIRKVQIGQQRQSVSLSEVTPRTLIQGFMEEHDSEQTVRKRPCLVPTPSPKKQSPSRQSRRSKRHSAGGLELRKQATVRNMIRRSTSGMVAEPTPRTIIKQMLAQGEEETPVILTRSKPLSQDPGLVSSESDIGDPTTSIQNQSADSSFLEAYLKYIKPSQARSSSQKSSQVGHRSKLAAWAKASQEQLSQLDSGRSVMNPIPEDVQKMGSGEKVVVDDPARHSDRDEDSDPLVSQDSNQGSSFHSDNVPLPYVGMSPSDSSRKSHQTKNISHDREEVSDRLEDAEDPGHGSYEGQENVSAEVFFDEKNDANRSHSMTKALETDRRMEDSRETVELNKEEHTVGDTDHVEHREKFTRQGVFAYPTEPAKGEEKRTSSTYNLAKDTVDRAELEEEEEDMEEAVVDGRERAEEEEDLEQEAVDGRERAEEEDDMEQEAVDGRERAEEEDDMEEEAVGGRERAEEEDDMEQEAVDGRERAEEEEDLEEAAVDGRERAEEEDDMEQEAVDGRESPVPPSVTEDHEDDEALPHFNATFSQQNNSQRILSPDDTGVDGYSRLRTPVLPPRGSKEHEATPVLPTPITTGRRHMVQSRLAPLVAKENKKSKKPAPAKSKRKQPSQTAFPPRLPSSLTKSIFGHFANCRISKETLVEVEKVADDFWKKLIPSLTAFARHAHRSTIDESDIELLMQRQRLVTERQSMYTLVENFLPLEYRQEIIPIARAGNRLEPK